MNPEPAAHARLDPAIALGMSFVSRSVQSRRDEVAKVRLRVAWEALGRSRAMTEPNRALLTQRFPALAGLIRPSGRVPTWVDGTVSR